MDLRVFTEPQQGADYRDLLQVATTAENAGYDGFFRSDHYLSMGDASGLPGPTDAWATLAALAVQTSRITLGTLVTSATFRYPGPLAITVAQVDQMSGGRVEFGYGAGWFADEHAAYGIPFPDVKERFDRYTENLEVITGLWKTPPGENYSYHGDHLTITDSPALPKPYRPGGIPVIIGGAGKKRTPALAAKYASEFNAAFTSVATADEQFARVRAALTATGRNEDSIKFSAAQVVCVGGSDREIGRRATAIGRDVDELRANGVAGSPQEAIDKLQQFAAIGADRVYLQFLDLSDLDHLEFVASEVLPHV